MKIKTKDGFMALFSVIIISFVLLGISISLNFSSLYSISSSLQDEYKMQSENLASACISIARLNIARGGYKENEIQELNVGGSKCEYVLEAPNKITGHACVSNVHTFYEAYYDPTYTEIPLSELKETPESSAPFYLCL